MIVEVKKFKMNYIITRSDGSEALYHHGIKGQKWGIRRYRNANGTLTEAGKRRYGNFNDNRKRRTKSSSGKSKKALAIAGGVAGVALASVALAKSPYGKKAIRVGKNVAKETLRQIAKKSPNAISDVVINTGKTASTVLITGGMIYGGEKLIAKQLGKEASEKTIRYGREPRKK